MDWKSTYSGVKTGATKSTLNEDIDSRGGIARESSHWVSIFRGTLSEEDFKQPLGNWSTICSADLEENVFTQNDVFTIHCSHTMITAVAAVMIYTKTGIIITVPKNPSYPGIKVAVVMQNSKIYEYIINPNVDKLAAQSMEFGVWVTSVEIPVWNLNQELLFYDDFLCHQFTKNIHLMEWLKSQEYKDKHRSRVGQHVKNGNGRVTPNQAIKELYEYEINLEKRQKYKDFKESLEKVCTIEQILCLAKEKNNIDGVDNIIALGERILGFPSSIEMINLNTECVVYSKTEHEYKQIQDTLHTVVANNTNEVGFLAEKLLEINAPLYKFYSSYKHRPKMYDLSIFSPTCSLYKILDTFNNKRKVEIQKAEEKAKAYDNFQDLDMDISTWTLEQLYSLHREFNTPYIEPKNICDHLKNRNYFRERCPIAPVRDKQSLSKIYHTMRMIHGASNSCNLQNIIKTAETNIDLGSSYWIPDECKIQTINKWVDMLAILRGVKNLPHFSITTQSDKTELDFEIFIESLNEFTATDTEFVLPYRVDAVSTTHDIFYKTFHTTCKHWDDRIKVYKTLCNQITESVSHYKQTLDNVERLVETEGVNLSDIYLHTIEKKLKNVWWNIVTTLASSKQIKLMQDVIQSFPELDVQKRTQFEQILKNRSVYRPGKQNDCLNMDKFITEIINYIWRNSNFDAVFKQFVLSEITQIQNDNKSKIHTISTSIPEAIEINMTINNKGVSKSYIINQRDLNMFSPELCRLLNILRSIHGSNISGAVKDFIHCLFQNTKWPKLCDEDKVDFQTKDSAEYIHFVQKHIGTLLHFVPCLDILNHIINKKKMTFIESDIEKTINIMHNWSVVYPARFFSIANVNLPIEIQGNETQDTSLLVFDLLFKSTSTIQQKSKINNNWCEVIKSVVDNITLFFLSENSSLPYELTLQILDQQYWQDKFFYILEEIIKSTPPRLSFDIKKSKLVHTSQTLKTDIDIQDPYTFQREDVLELYNWNFITPKGVSQTDKKKELQDVSIPTTSNEIHSLVKQPQNCTFKADYYNITAIRAEPLPQEQKERRHLYFTETYNDVLQDFETLTICPRNKQSNPPKIKSNDKIESRDESKQAKTTHKQAKTTHIELSVKPLSSQTITKANTIKEDMKNNDRSTETQCAPLAAGEDNLIQPEKTEEMAYDEIEVNNLYPSQKIINLKYFVNNIFHAREIYSDINELLE